MTILHELNVSFKGVTHTETHIPLLSVGILKASLSQKFHLDVSKLVLRVGKRILEPDNRLVADCGIGKYSVIEIADSSSDAAKKLSFKVEYKDETDQIIKKKLLFTDYDEFISTVTSSFFPLDTNALVSMCDVDGFELDSGTLEAADPDQTFTVLKKIRKSVTPNPNTCAGQEIELRVVEFCKELQQTSIWLEQTSTLQKLKDKVQVGSLKNESVIFFTKHCPIPDTVDNMNKTLAFWGINHRSTVQYLRTKELDREKIKNSDCAGCFHADSNHYPFGIQPTEAGMSLYLCGLKILVEYVKNLDETSQRTLFFSLNRLFCFPVAVNAIKHLAMGDAIIPEEKQALACTIYSLIEKSRLHKKGGEASTQIFEFSSPIFCGILNFCSKTALQDNCTENFAEYSLLDEETLNTLVDPVIIEGLVLSRQTALDKAGQNIKTKTIPLTPESNWLVDTFRPRLLEVFGAVGEHRRKCYIWSLSSDLNISKALLLDTDYDSLERIINQAPQKKDSTAEKSLETFANLFRLSSVASVRRKKLGMYQNQNGRVCMSMEGSKLSANEINVYDSSKYTEEVEKIDEIQKSLEENKKPLPLCYTSPVTKELDFEPTEIIMAVIDRSLSMNSKDFSDDKKNTVSRLWGVQQCFIAFSDRTEAFSYDHHIGCEVFNTKVEKTLDFTPDFSKFCKEILKITGSGSTNLYGAIEKGIQDILEYAKKFKDLEKLPILRLLVLADGEDNNNKVLPQTLAKQLLQNHIILDGFLIGNGENNHNLKQIAFSTGGYCFKPANISECLKLFENELVLSVSQRPKTTIADEITEKIVNDLFEKHKISPFSEAPSREIPPETKKMIQNSYVALQRFYMAIQQQATKQKPAVGRIMKELALYYKSPHPNIKIFPLNEDVSFWLAAMEAPSDTPYAGGNFMMFIRFPEEYPKKAPEVRFLTKIYHCNISSDGKICHSILGHNYFENTTIRTIMNCIYGLFLAPEPQDPLDSLLAAEMLDKPDEYNKHAKEFTEKHGNCNMKMKEFCQNLLNGYNSFTDDIDKSLICPLSGEIFQDPVITPGGGTYERKEIEKFIDQHGHDPSNTELKLTKKDLVPNAHLKNFVLALENLTRDPK